METSNDISNVVKGNPSQYVKLNVGGSLHYTTIGNLVENTRDEDPVVFSLDTDPTCNNGFIKLLSS